MLTRRDALKSVAGFLAAFVCLEEPVIAGSPKTWLRRLPDGEWESVASCEHLRIGDMVRILGDESYPEYVALRVMDGPFSPQECARQFGSEKVWGWGVGLAPAHHDSAKVSQKQLAAEYADQLRAARSILDPTWEIRRLANKRPGINGSLKLCTCRGELDDHPSQFPG